MGLVSRPLVQVIVPVAGLRGAWNEGEDEASFPVVLVCTQSIGGDAVFGRGQLLAVSTQDTGHRCVVRFMAAGLPGSASRCREGGRTFSCGRFGIGRAIEVHCPRVLGAQRLEGTRLSVSLRRRVWSRCATVMIGATTITISVRIATGKGSTNPEVVQ